MDSIHIRVLVVDDSAAIRWRVSCMLKELDTVEVVGQARGASAALELARQLNPDVVTLDPHMQGRGGLPLIEELKALEPPPTIMVLTSFPYSAYRTRAKQAGADFFFDKSTEFHKVLAILANGI